MECPRCGSQVPDQSVTCPVCSKALTPGSANPQVHLPSMGESIPTSAPPPPTTYSTPSPMATLPPTMQPPADPHSHVVIHSSNPKVQAAIQHHPPAQAVPSGPRDRRWLIVYFALFGVLCNLILFALSFISALDLSSVSIADGRHGGMSPCLLTAFGTYCLLAFITWVFLPAPWTYDGFYRGLLTPGIFRTRRINWVLSISGFLAAMVFILMSVNHTFARLRAVYPSRNISSETGIASDENRMPSELAAWQEASRIENRAGALSLLICYTSVAGYGTWWLRKRPQIPAINPQGDDGSLWTRQY